MKFGVLVLVMLFSCYFSSAQEKGFNLINYTQDDDLPSNETYCVFRDSRDFLWIATDKGVVRYNGNKMQPVNLPDNVIFKIREDRKGRIWFFSYSGQLAYFLNEKVVPFKYNKNIRKAVNNMLTSDAYVDDDDNIIINSGISRNYKITNTGEVLEHEYLFLPLPDTFKIELNQVSPYHYFSQIDKFNAHLKEMYVTIRRTGGSMTIRVPTIVTEYSHYGTLTINGDDIYFFSGNQLFKFNKNGSYSLKKFSSKILSLADAGNGEIWIGLLKGGAMLINTDMEMVFPNPILAQHSISSICQDYEGVTWFSTLEHGVYLLKNRLISYYVGEPDLSAEILRAATYHDTELLVATSKGIYLVTGDKTSKLIEQPTRNVTDLFVTPDDNIYVAATPMLALEKLTQIRIEKNSKVVFITGSSEVNWLTDQTIAWNHGNLLMEFDISKIPPLPLTHAIDFSANRFFRTLYGTLFADRSKQLWSGTINGLFKIQPLPITIPFIREGSVYERGNLLEPVLADPANIPELSKGVACIRQLDNGLYVIGARFGGILLMKDSNIIAHITEREGLINNSVRYILVMKNQFWVATAKGISVIQFQSFAPISYSIANIGKNEGVYNFIINQLIPYRGNILAATSDGLYTIEHPSTLLNRKLTSMPFYINEVIYYKGSSTTDTVFSVPYNKTRFAIRYNAVSYNSKGEIDYYYRFSNKDTTWLPVYSTELLLDNLSPGRYQLEIKADIVVQGRSSDIKKILLIIHEPWWQNNWLRVGVLFLLGAGIYFFYKNRIRKIKREEEQKTAIKTKMMELEQKLLRSQMNPHFIFNSLSSIQQLIFSDNRLEANEYLVKFSTLIRKTLQLSTMPFIKLREEIEYLSEYLNLEQARMATPFEFVFDLALNDSTDHIEIPHMLLQPILENSIRHGVKHLEEKQGNIRITMKQESSGLRCIITDNGIGRASARPATGHTNPVDHKSYGIDIVKKRLYVLHENPLREELISIDDLRDDDGNLQGTSVTLLLPYKINKS